VLVEEGFEFGEDDEGFGVGAVLVFGGAVFDAGPAGFGEAGGGVLAEPVVGGEGAEADGERRPQCSRWGGRCLRWVLGTRRYWCG
jgi:hypothetical protein